MARPSIKLYFDIVSPFAYFAFWALENLGTFRAVQKTYIPIFLGGLMKACNNRPPIEITNKNKWINVERLRWAQLFHIPVKTEMPDGFPILTLSTQRALTAVSLSYPELLPACTAALYSEFWVDHGKVNEPAVITRVLGTVLTQAQADEVLSKTSTQQVKDTLSKKTQEAFADDAFGLPWFVATNTEGEVQKFWGFDHIGQVADFLGLERPTREGWKAVL